MQQLHKFVGLTSILAASFIINQKVAAQELDSSTTKQITNILTSQTKAWNDGDLEKFMETYWKSDKLTFSSRGKTKYGWQATLDNYRKNYAPPKEMGKLHFDHLEVMMIEASSALVLGHWHLRMKNDEKLDGNFSLVVKKINGAWKIIHDHSSSRELKPDMSPQKDKK